MSNPFNPSTNTFTDNIGRPYQTPDNKAPMSGTTVTSTQNGQQAHGQIIGGVFVPNKY